ncbi:integrase, catalytic region, zinc finger, CCHC-type containing protein [Tanacetum coccineum]|uniref:Integrase, catalytic region, zinc finger, CCHC-type containing protein n=1 Tax=Tanacetum coccineum TaxID=301880 RepID=A0ABQ4WBS1_9ASTR
MTAALSMKYDFNPERFRSDRLLALRLQDEERESSSLWKREQSSFMIQLQLKEGFLQNKELLQSEINLLQELKTPKKDDTIEVPAKQDVAKQGTKKRKGGHIKMIARKKPRQKSDVDSEDEHRKCLKIVPLDNKIDIEVMETKSVIAKLNKIMMESLQEENDQSDFWDDQQDWEIVTWRLYEACGVYILELKDGTVIHIWIAKDVDEDGKCLKIRSRCVKVFGYILQELKKINLKKHEVKQVQQSCLGEDCWELFIPDLVPLDRVASTLTITVLSSAETSLDLPATMAFLPHFHKFHVYQTYPKVEVPKELSKVSMANTSLKKLKHHLDGFDVVVKERTMTTAITEGSKFYSNGTYSVSNQSALNFDQYFELNELKAQSQEKDTVIKKLKERIKSLSGNMNEDKVKKDIEEIETINIELDHRHSKLNANSELLCVKCNGCMLYDNHDLCVLDFINDVNTRAKSKSVKKSSKRKVWKPTGKVFTNIRYTWRPTGRTFTIVGNTCPLTRITTTAEVPLRKPIALETDTPKPVVALVYARKANKSKTNVTISKPKIIKSISANKKEPTIHGLVRGLLKLKFKKDHLCSACAMGKRKKKPHKPKSKDTNQEKLYLLHMDLCGPMRVTSVNGKKYILVIVDDYSRFTWVKCLRSKDEAPDFIIKFLKMIQQNGVVERRNCTLIEVARTMLIYAKALLFLWAEAVVTACYTQNHSIICLHHGKIPYELLHDKLPDLLFFYVFGALCYPTNDSENLGKLQPKADIGIFISYAPTKKAFRIYNHCTRRILEIIHVDFDELTAMASKHSSLEPVLHEMTPAIISSGLVPNLPPSTPFVTPSRTDWDVLFQPLFDELLNPLSSVDRPAPEVIAPIAEVVAPESAASTGSPSSTTIDQDAPSPSNSQTTPETQFLVISNDVEEENHDLDIAHMNNDPFFGIPIPKNVSESSSSSDVIPTIAHTAAPNS